jgi:hypothetical protein
MIQGDPILLEIPRYRFSPADGIQRAPLGHNAARRVCNRMTKSDNIEKFFAQYRS